VQAIIGVLQIVNTLHYYAFGEVMRFDWNKIISAEVLSTSAVLIFSVGVAYTTLARWARTGRRANRSAASQTRADARLNI
jgi:hypothetical protein